MPVVATLRRPTPSRAAANEGWSLAGSTGHTDHDQLEVTAMPDWVPVTETAPDSPAGIPVEEQLAAERQLTTLLRESYADLEALYREDVGWTKVGAEATQFTAAGRKRIAALADLSVTGNALIKRGMALRTVYVWGAGVTVRIDDDGTTGQDVHGVLAAFWADKSNRRAFTAREAQMRYERRLGTGGEAFWALPTDQRTGRVRVRRIPASQIVDRICDPEDDETVWFYVRSYTAILLAADGTKKPEQRHVLHPALDFRPAIRPKVWQGKTIAWDAPVRHVAVNVPDEDWRGLGDVLAAMPWAKVDKEFLEDLAVYMRALTRILGQVKAGTGRAARAAQAAMAGSTTAPGAMVATDPGTTLSMVSKSGAQIDGDTHRPFATMVAAALEVPLTMLLGDPGITGARATAETLDSPTEGTFDLRREVHADLFRDIADYVVDAAVIAPAGPLRGTVVRDGDQLLVALPEGDSRDVVVEWPTYDSTPLKDAVAAIATAADLQVLPEVEIVKLLAAAFELEDVDDLVKVLTDDAGNWIGPAALADMAAAVRGRQGEDPL